jgi:putative addiction module component (TIGR02574 family)
MLSLKSRNNLKPMSTVTIRKELQEYLNNADERFIQLVYGMMQADKSNDFLLSETERKELDKRIARHKTGESKSYSWEEVKTRLQG